MRAEELDVVVVGGANTDFLIRGPSLPGPGRSVEGDTFQQAPGGKGANQAVGAARLEATVALIARIGQDARGVLKVLSDGAHDHRAELHRRLPIDSRVPVPAAAQPVGRLLGMPMNRSAIMLRAMSVVPP